MANSSRNIRNLVALLIVLMSAALSSHARAACSSPAGVAGTFTYIGSPTFDLMFCDDTTWRTMGASSPGAACSPAGLLELNSGTYRYCNGSNWRLTENGSTGVACTAGDASKLRWNAAEGQMEQCYNLLWRVTGQPAPNPCSGKTVGQTCTSTTALYAGNFAGGRYMVMPSGCANSTSNPSCSGGTDTVQKTWDDGVNGIYDVPTLTNINGQGNPSAVNGGAESAILAAITAPAEGGVHAAAKYCDDMVYGGFSDWFLPSKTELMHLYCKSTPSSHSTFNPVEYTNCGGSGPTNQLTGFNSGLYWNSTEFDFQYAWILQMSSGGVGQISKTSPYYVRCIRKF